jgi:hypothetical protein
MARVFGSAVTSEIALAAATAKTVLQLVAASNHKVALLGWGVFFDGVSVTGEPVQVVLMRQTDAGTASALTCRQTQTAAETIQTTAQHTASAEPSSSDILDVLEVHPQSGYEIKFPPGEEIWLNGGTRLGIVCTAPAICNVRAKVFFEE